MKHFLFLFVLTAVFAAFAKENNARIIIGRAESKITLTFEKEENIGKYHAAWLGKNADKVVVCELPASDVWRKGKITVTPRDSGRLLFELSAMDVRVKGEHVPFGYYYDNIRINGKLIDNGGLEDGPRGYGYYRHPKVKNFPGRVVFDPSVACSGKACAAAWAWGPMTFAIHVEKDVPIVLTLDYRKAGLLAKESEQNHHNALSLEKVANMGFADAISGDGKGGWTDQGAMKDLSSIPTGLRSGGGIPYLLVDPASNGGKSCVILKSVHSTYGSEGFTLPVNRECNRISLLTGAAWAEKDVSAANVSVKFYDGHTETFPLIVGKNIWEWTDVRKTLPGGVLVWNGVNSSGSVAVYGCTFRFKKPGMVRSVTVRPEKNTSVVLGIIAVTASDVRVEPKDPIAGLSWKISLPGKSVRIAVPFAVLAKKMKEKKFPADLFLDREKSLSRLHAFDASGKELPMSIALYRHNLPPVLLVRADAGTDTVVLKAGTERKEILKTPEQAINNIFGKRRIVYDDAPWKDGILLRPRQARLVNAEIVRDFDSLYREAISLRNEKAEIYFDFELKEPKTVKLFVNIRHPYENSQANRVRAFFDGKPMVVVGGVYYKKLCFYWTGGERVKLGAGKHTLKLDVRGKREERKDMEIASFYLGFGLHSPESSGFSDETGALLADGVTVYGTSAKTPELKNIPSKDRLYRMVNPSRSWPDLSSLVQNRIDRRGALRPDGASMRFADGTELPFIWGRNIESECFYKMWKTNRLGSAGGDGIDRLMKRYKELGISALRFFVVTMPRAEWTNINEVNMTLLDARKMIYHPDYLEGYQRMIAAAHKHGIRLKITFGSFPWTVRHISGQMQSMFYHPEVIERCKKRMRMILDTPNPYRNNIRPADDPTICILEIENECNFLGGGFGRRALWKDMNEKDKNDLYPHWRKWLEKKYKTFENLRKCWRTVPLIVGKTKESFENVEFPPSGDASKWGTDKSDFKVKMDDLRVSAASFGKEKRSNPIASDGFEFMYDIYSAYLTDMRDYLRSLGFKGIITACGPDTENYYTQRAAVNAKLDAVSGGTSYWNRSGYGFLKALNWLDPMIYAAAPDKPVISREYGANLFCENSWWGNLISAAVQKAMGKAYLFDFTSAIPGPDISTDYLYPEDDNEQRSIFLLHDLHFRCTMANIASAIAVRSDELKKSPFKLDIAYPLDHVFYTAPFRGLNRTTFSDFVPFLYTDSNIRTYDGAYRWNADLVVNEPSMATGDFSKAKYLYLIRPHSGFDRYGNPAQKWYAGKKFVSDGFLDSAKKRSNLYDAILAAGGKLPVSKDEFCNVWRDTNRHLEIDTVAGTFRGDTSSWGAFIGDLTKGTVKAPRFYTPSGSGDAWTFFGKIPEYDLFMAVMNGCAEIKDASRLKFMYLGTSSIDVTVKGKKLVSVIAGTDVEVGFKTDGVNLETAETVFVTFYRSRSCQLPASVSFGRDIVSVKACNREGATLADVPHSKNGFENLWQNGHMISHYEIRFKK